MPWLVLTLICLASLVAGYAGAYWGRVSASSRTTKRFHDMEMAISDLTSSFENLLESHKRLRSRAGMRELRQREAEPERESKAAVRKRLFGVAAGPAFAARQAELNGRNTD